MIIHRVQLVSFCSNPVWPYKEAEFHSFQLIDQLNCPDSVQHLYCWFNPFCQLLNLPLMEMAPAAIIKKIAAEQEKNFPLRKVNV